MQRVICNKCKHTWTYEPPLGRGDECPKCHWDAHVCLNCKHYDRNFHHECRESQAEYVQVKDRSNFCDYFEPKQNASQAGDDKAKVMSSLDQLFGAPKSDSAPASSAPKSLNDELEAFLKNKGK